MKLDSKTGRDLLTNMYGRRVFFEMAKAMIAKQAAGYYILSYINVENFKFVNTKYGQETGDKVLQHIGGCTTRCMNTIGGIAGRIGADAFVILFPAMYADTKVMTDLYIASAAPDCIDEKLRLRVGRFVVSITEAPVEAMYDYAKIASDSVRDNYEKHIEYYNEFMSDELLRREKIVYEMDSALANGEFEPWLQPQYNHATGAMIGAEVLVRWNRNGTYISPAEFIPIFEENGFIYELDKYIWEQSCRLLRRWLDEGKTPLPLSVNISRRDILHDDFIASLTDILSRYDIPAAMLRLEVTESAFAEESEQIISSVSELISRGFVVEIDDFGSGYSSLNTLKDVPSSVLKLDMKFFESTENSRRAGNIIESVVRMARLLGMAVIAEGVEDKAQADYLKSIGCYYIQGYYYARPMPIEQYEALAGSQTKERQLSRIKTVETMDHNEFWNPRSMDTLIFNSYVGGACIFEYYQGETEIIRVNDQYINEFGGIIPKDTDLHGAAISKHMDEDNHKVLSEALQKAIDTGKEASCEVAISREGQTEYIRATVRVIAKADERFLFYGVISNMTEQRMAQINERNMATQLDVMMRSIHAAVTATVFKKRNDFDVVYINDGFYELYGYTKDQYDSEVAHINDLMLPEDRESTMDIVEKVVREKKAITHEFRGRRRDGSIIWVQMTNSMTVLDGIGDILMGVAVDVTERHMLEAREAALADRLGAVLNSIENGITASYRINGRTEFLIVNDRFYELHGLSKETADLSVIDTILDLTHPEDRERVRAGIINSVINGRNSALEYRIIKPGGQQAWIKVANSTTHISGVEGPVNVAVFSDVTDEKEYNLQLEFLNEAAHDILAQTDYKTAINHTLQETLEYFGGQRAYVFEADYEAGTISSTYEACSEGVSSEMSGLQQIPLEFVSGWLELFANRQLIEFDDIEQSADIHEELRKILISNEVASLIIAPLWSDGRLYGFVCVENPSKAVKTLKHLAALGDYIAILLVKRDLMEDIDIEHQKYMEIITVVPGGFIRLKRNPAGNTVPIYVSNGMKDLLGMDEEAVQRIYGDNVLNGIHPDDVQTAIASGDKMLRTEAVVSDRYRIMAGDGSYLWVVSSGKATTDLRGETYLNLYYIDISEQMNQQQN